MNDTPLNQYKSVGLQSGMMDASPHQMISLLLEGALDKVAAARGAIERQDISHKGELLSRAIAIVDGTRACLDHQRGGEISANLVALYDYIEQRLVEANLASDVRLLDEVSGLLRHLKTSWESIPVEQRGS